MNHNNNSDTNQNKQESTGAKIGALIFLMTLGGLAANFMTNIPDIFASKEEAKKVLVDDEQGPGGIPFYFDTSYDRVRFKDVQKDSIVFDGKTPVESDKLKKIYFSIMNKYPEVGSHNYHVDTVTSTVEGSLAQMDGLMMGHFGVNKSGKLYAWQNMYLNTANNKEIDTTVVVHEKYHENKEVVMGYVNSDGFGLRIGKDQDILRSPMGSGSEQEVALLEEGYATYMSHSLRGEPVEKWRESSETYVPYGLLMKYLIDSRIFTREELKDLHDHSDVLGFVQKIYHDKDFGNPYANLYDAEEFGKFVQKNLFFKDFNQRKTIYEIKYKKSKPKISKEKDNNKRKSK